MKSTQMILLCALAIVVVVTLIIPSMANLLSGMGVELPKFLARSTHVRLAYSYPLILLVVGLMLLTSLGYILWRVVHN